MSISRFFRSGRVLIWMSALCAGVLSSCVSVSVRSAHIGEDEQATVSMIDRLHSLFNEEKWEEICHEADRSFCATDDKTNSMAPMQETLNRFGRFKRLTFVKTSVLHAPPIQGAPDEVRAVCNSDFDKGPVTELLVFKRQNGQFHLARYEIFFGTVTPKL